MSNNKQSQTIAETTRTVFISTIVTTTTQGAIIVWLNWLSTWPEWLSAALIVATGLSLAAITQRCALFRHWQIGLVVCFLGILVFQGTHTFADSSISAQSLQKRPKHWSLVLSWGAMFGGCAWFLTSLMLNKSTRKLAPVQTVVVLGTSGEPEKKNQKPTSRRSSPIITSLPSSVPTPISQNSGGFVAFTRFVNITEKPIGNRDTKSQADYRQLKTHEMASVVESLTRVNAECGNRYIYKSSFGCFVVEPHGIESALLWATSILRGCTEAGVQVAIGLARDGQLEVVDDLHGRNLIGKGVNVAARLAHLPNGIGRIAVDESLLPLLEDLEHRDECKVGDSQHQSVKNTPLSFRWLDIKLPILGQPQKSSRKVEVNTLYTVVYDVANYSTQNGVMLGSTVNELRRAVISTLAQVGVASELKAVKRRYSPAGDGGAFLFKESNHAWRFSNTLLEEAEKYGLPIRVGMAFGQVCLVDGWCPVGRAIYEADYWSALPKNKTGCLCAARNFWESSLGFDIRGEQEDATALWTGSRRVEGEVEIDEKSRAIILTRNNYQQPIPSRRWNVLAVLLLVLVLIVAVSMQVLGKSEEATSGEETGTELGNQLQVRQDLQDISESCRNQSKMVSLFGYEGGMIPLGSHQLDEFARRMGPKIRRIKESPTITPSIQNAEVAVVSALISLRSSPKYPGYRSTEELTDRLKVLLAAYDTLTAAGTKVKSHEIYNLILHARFLIAYSVNAALGNSGYYKKGINDPQLTTIRKIVRKQIQLVDREVKSLKARDGLLAIDSILASLKTLNDIKAVADQFRVCSELINTPPKTRLCSVESLRLRLHILRLQLFNFLVQSVQYVNSKMKDFALLRELAGLHQQIPGSTAIDESFDFIRTAVTKNQRVPDMKIDWIDTLLAQYSDLHEATKKMKCPPLWNHMHLRMMMREQITQSQNFIKTLLVNGELSPDYLSASIRLHVYVTRDCKFNDIKELERIAIVGKEYVLRLWSERGILQTPMRCWPASAERANIEKHRNYFTDLLRRLRNQQPVPLPD